MSLKNVTDEELKKELAERERKKKAAEMPKPLAAPDYSRLVKMLEGGIKSIAEVGHPGKDFDHYVFEEALMAVYGRKIWDWYNKNNRGD